MSGRTLALLAVGVLAVSVAAPLIAALTVPALAIAFWRNAFATAAIAPVVGWRSVHRDMQTSRTGQMGRPVAPDATLAGPATATPRHPGDATLVLVAGLCLAAHFGFWVSSLEMTSVASSTAIVSLQVIWVAGYDALRGVPLGGSVAAGVLVATLGAIVVGGVDLSISTRALAGDALALVGSIAVAAYAMIGGRVRQRVPTSTYTLGAYGAAAAALLVAALVARQPLTGYAADQWLGLLALTATAQLLGHSVFNHLLATVSPLVVSLALLLEIPGAAIIAAAWLGQVPGPTTVVGLAMVLGGMVAVVLSERSPAAPPTAPA